LNETKQAIDNGDMIDNYCSDMYSLLNETKQAVDNGDMTGNYYCDMYGPFMKMLNYDYRLFLYSC
jgi:hypothetical protein